jgi:hypothetical protein
MAEENISGKSRFLGAEGDGYHPCRGFHFNIAQSVSIHG